MYRLIATGYIALLFFVFLFVFVRSDQSASYEPLIASTQIITSPSPTPEPTATPTPTPAASPVRLVIPKLNLDVAIESKGEDAAGHMDVPSWENVAWYNLGPRPGEEGSAVIAGHYDTTTGAPSTFYQLSSLQAGDEIYVQDELNNVLRFTVKDMRNYDYFLFPINEVFADPVGRKLNLITCSGTWNHAMQTYSDRLVVFAELQ